MIHREAADDAGDEPVGAQPRPRKLIDERERQVHDLLGLRLIDLFLLQERLELLVQVLRERRHGGRREMQGAEKPPDKLQRREYFAVQAGRLVVKVTEADDLDEIEQPG